MSLGADALLLVALCGMTSWLLGRRRRRAQRPPSLPEAADEGLHALRPQAAICQPAQPGQPARDFVITEVLQPSHGAAASLLCRLDGGGDGAQALLLVPALPSLHSDSERRVWLLVPMSQRPVAPAAEPPQTISHAGCAYTQHADWRGLLHSLPGTRGAAHRDSRLVLYRGRDRQCALWWQQGEADHWYAGHELALAELEILPS